MTENELRFSAQEFGTLCDWLMASDPFPLENSRRQRMVDMLNDEARARGYDDWIQAYHDNHMQEDPTGGIQTMTENPKRTISESADKIVFKCKTTRGEGTRDQDKGDLKVKGNDPEEVAQKVAETLDALEEQSVHEKLRSMQPGESDD